MFSKRVPLYSFLLILVQLIRITHLTYHDTGHGFMTKKDRYFDDELTHIHEEIGSLGYFQQDGEALDSLHLRFEPEVLDFRERTLGVPHSHTVTLFNTDSNRSIDLTSISGSTVHFHSSFFEDKQIPPNGNTTFKVVYLGRQEGLVQSSLFLHTSSGFIKYHVRAIGIFNNYRVRPIVGVKLPVNSTFTPVIYMHNPHLEPIQIVEIYSSGGGFHLELPEGQHEGPNDLWEINPHETKAIIRVRFEAKVAHNHTAYIRIKLHNPDEVLIVPLEVEVAPIQNIFHPQGHVDFGVGGSLDDSKEINLCLFNPFKRSIRIHSVSTLSKSIRTQYYNTRLNPANEEDGCVNVGSLTVDWKNAWQNQDYHGKIIVKFRNGKNRTEIPYFITVLKGGISYDKMSTAYFLNGKEMDTKERKFRVRNEFSLPIRVIDVKFPPELDSTFKFQTNTPVTIKPGDKKTLFNIWLKSGSKKNDLQMASFITVVTNVSNINVPLLSYNGKLQVHLPSYASDDKTLNIGLIGHFKKIQIRFSLYNPNPIELSLRQLSNSVPMGELEVQGCGVGDYKGQMMGNLSKCDSISPLEYAVLKLTINTNDNNGKVKGDISVQTPFENISIAVHYTVAEGEMIIDRDDLIFDNCFPTKICPHPIRVFSTFSEKMFVENIIPVSPDKRINSVVVGTIVPKMNRVIGWIFFNPDLECFPECYVGFVNEGSASWLRTLVISKQVSEYDVKLVNVFYHRYLSFTKNLSRTVSNVTMRLDTTEVKGQTFVSKINYTWPSLIKDAEVVDNVLDFPLTQVHNQSFRPLTLHNPSNYNVVLQLIFEHDYPHSEMLYDGLPHSFIPASKIKYINSNWFSFETAAMEQQKRFFWENMDVNSNKNSLPLFLSPGQSKTVKIRFLAEEARPYSSLLIIRNNLTALEIVRLKGKGTVPRFEFTSLRSQIPSKIFDFDLSEKHLKPCNPELADFKPYLPDITLKDSFVARNLGEVAIKVTGFKINGQECEGFGFRVIDCKPFTLQPNTSKKLEVEFTPDFTLVEVSRELVIETSLNNKVNYTLAASVVRSYCRHCSLLIDRPPWEKYLSYTAITFLHIMLILVVSIAILDANTIKARAIEIYLSSQQTPSMLPVLDLRKIGRQVREEIQSSLKEKPQEQVPTKVEPYFMPTMGKAIVPTTGKAKRRKIGEREVSVEEDKERERPKKKDILFERHRLKSQERREEKEMRLEEEKKKRKLEMKRKRQKAVEEEQLQQQQQQQGDEESVVISTNGDEVDKENQRVSSKLKNVSSQTINDKDTQEGKSKHVSFDHKPKNRVFKEQDKDQIDKIDETKRRRRHIKYKEKKDKSSYRNKKIDRKQSGDSEPVLEKEISKNPPNFYIPLPTPVTPCAGWCESKAKFSDVVARTDQPTDPSPVSTESSESPPINDDLEDIPQNSSPFKPPKVPNKPTMYVEPYKPFDLGPIGSKRFGTPENDSPEMFLQEATNYLPATELHPALHDKSVIAAVTGNTSFLGAGATSGIFGQTDSSDVWNRQQVFRDITRREEGNRIGVFGVPEEDDSWRNLNTRPVNNQPPNTDYWSNTFSSVLNSTSKLANNASYLWGSSPIWKPWTPADSPVRRTPPGFDEHIQKKRAEEEQKRRQNEYKSYGNSPWSQPWD